MQYGASPHDCCLDHDDEARRKDPALCACHRRPGTERYCDAAAVQELPTPLEVAKDEATRAALLATPKPFPAGAVPPDVAALLTRLRLFSHGAALCKTARVRSVAQLRLLTEIELKALVPDMTLVERRLLFTEVAQAAAQPAPAALGAVSGAGGDGARATSWDFFLSHVQAEGGRSMRVLQGKLEARGRSCWLDRSQAPTGANIERDVPRCRVFLLYLTRSIFTRKWCLFEVLCALRARLPIVLLLERRRGVPLPGLADTDVDELKASMPFVPGAEHPILKPLLDQCVALSAAFDEEDLYFNAMLTGIEDCLAPGIQRAVVVDVPEADLTALHMHIQRMP